MKKAATPKERKEALKAERLQDMKERIEDGTLVCRKMTRAEKKRYAR